jgi:hypothetical protein
MLHVWEKLPYGTKKLFGYCWLKTNGVGKDGEPIEL